MTSRVSRAVKKIGRSSVSSSVILFFLWEVCQACPYLHCSSSYTSPPSSLPLISLARNGQSLHSSTRSKTLLTIHHKKGCHFQIHQSCHPPARPRPRPALQTRHRSSPTRCHASISANSPLPPRKLQQASSCPPARHPRHCRRRLSSPSAPAHRISMGSLFRARSKLAIAFYFLAGAVIR